jgi:N-acetylglucosamine-6-sulfatase
MSVLFLLVVCSLPCAVLSKAPNIVLLLTDDQDELLGGEKPMQFTTNFFETNGARMKNFYVNTPVCCPSRATLISGRYPHNYLEVNGGGCMHMDVSSKDYSDKSIGRYLKNGGFTTGHFGKYLNPNGMSAYCGKEKAPLPGFDTWFSMCNDNKYFKNIFTDNGKIYESGTAPSDYLTSLIGNRSLAFMEKAINESKPFFAYIAPHAPHVPATPAPWYESAFSNLKAPRTPNWNYTALDHHYVIRQQEHLTAQIASESDALFRNRWRSLLSVDDIMKDVVKMLEEKGELSNTFFLWTSDHGFQLGQFNLPSCKLQPYEHDIHVPFYIAGPGIQKKSEFPDVVSMVDVAPTIITLGGGTPPATMDGSSFADSILGKTEAVRDRSMIEYWSLGNVVRYSHLIDGPNNTYIGVRVVNSTHNMLYVEFYQNSVGSTHALPHTFMEEPPVEFELYDLNKDYYQMKNLYGDTSYNEIVQELHNYIHRTVVCSGSTCGKK